MRMDWIALGLLVAGLAGSGCEKCLDGGRNGLPDPVPGQFTLVFSNIVDDDTELFVDGEFAGRVCAQTEYASVGNFPVDTHTTIEIHSLLSGDRCYISPNCDTDCTAQSCDGSPVIDTTPFEGQTYATGFMGY